MCKYKPNVTIQQELMAGMAGGNVDFPQSTGHSRASPHLPNPRGYSLEASSWDSMSYPQSVGAHRTGKGKESWDWNNWGEQQGPVIIYSQFPEDPRKLLSQAQDFTLTKQKGPTSKWKAMKGSIPRLGIKSCTCAGASFPPEAQECLLSTSQSHSHSS